MAKEHLFSVFKTLAFTAYLLFNAVNLIFLTSGLVLLVSFYINVEAYDFWFLHILVRFDRKYKIYLLYIYCVLTIIVHTKVIISTWTSYKTKLLCLAAVLILVAGLCVPFTPVVYHCSKPNLQRTMSYGFFSKHCYKLGYFKEVIDKWQQNNGCCGLHNYTDWNTTKELYGLCYDIPSSCCKTESYHCGARIHPSNIYMNGCLEKIPDITICQHFYAATILYVICSSVVLIYSIIYIIKKSKSHHEVHEEQGMMKYDSLPASLSRVNRRKHEFDKINWYGVGSSHSVSTE